MMKKGYTRALLWVTLLVILWSGLVMITQKDAAAQTVSPQTGSGQSTGTGAGVLDLVTGQTFYGLPGIEQRLNTLDFADMRGHWAFLPVLRLAAQGVVGGRSPGVFAPEEPVTKEEAVALLKRAAGTGSSSSTGRAGQNRFNLTANFTSAQASQPAQRQEVAAWLAQVLGLTPVAQGVYPLLSGFTDGVQVAAEWAPWVEALLREGLLSGTTYGTLAPGAPVTRAEMAALVDRADGYLAARRGVRRVEGQVVDRTVTTGADGGMIYTLRVATFAGPVINLEVRTAAGGAPLLDFPLYRRGSLALGRELLPGDALRLFLQGEQVLWAESLGEGQYRTGRVIAAYGQEIWLVDDKGEQYRLALSPLVSQEVVPGQEVNFAVQGDLVTQLVPVDAASSPAYSYQEVKTVSGQVREIRGDTLVVATTYGEEEIRVSSTTSISRGGRSLELSDLKIGDQVKARVEPGGLGVEVQVGAGNGRIAGVICGKLDKANYLDGRVVLRDTQEFYYGQWLPGSALRSLSIAREAWPSSASSTSLSWSRPNLSSEKVLVVLAQGPQGQEGVRLVRVGEHTRLYEGYLDSVSLGGKKLWLEVDEEPFLLDGDYIIIKNGQMAAPEDLKHGDYVFMVATPGTDGRRIALVFTETLLPPAWRLYRGEIYSIAKEDLELDEVEKLGGGEDQYDWSEAEDDTMEFELSWEPVILSGGKTLSRQEFIQSRFSEDFYDYQAYMVCRDKEVWGLSLYPPGTLEVTKMSLGKVKEVDYSSAQMTVEAVRDWSPGYQSWQTNDFSLDLSLENALVLKGRQMASWKDLDVEDTIYFVHDNRRALLVVVPD